MKGSYVLVLYLPRVRRLTVGKLGSHRFEPGYYLYFGSALNSLEGRLRRHLLPEKKLHWHIDFLSEKATIKAIWWCEGIARQECAWTQIALNFPGISTPVKGFGSSDCRNCTSHLAYLSTSDEVAALGQIISTASSEKVTHSAAGVTDSMVR